MAKTGSVPGASGSNLLHSASANPNSMGQTNPLTHFATCSKTDLIVNDNIVLGCHVVSYVVVHNESQQPIKQGQVNLFIHLLKAGLQHDIALALTGLPHILQVIDA